MHSAYHIATSGPPVHARVCRLGNDILSAAKAKFEDPERLGIIRRSSSPWSSPLQIVKKAMEDGALVETTGG